MSGWPATTTANTKSDYDVAAIGTGFARFEALPDAVIVIGADRSIVYANARADRLFKYRPGELNGLRVDSLFSGEHQEPYFRVTESVLARRHKRPTPGGREFRARTRDGREFPVELTSGPRIDGNHVVAVIRDITERVQSREKLADALREIEELKDRLQAETQCLIDEIKTSHNFEEIIGNSAPMMAMLYKVEQVAATDASVLLLGETGTGKELLARAIHARSKRKARPLIKVDCSTLPPGLVESELFGHEKGAFTGAHEMKPGRFELADGGTVFLDEIGELPLGLQSKLLRVIQEGEFQRLGSKRVKQVDVRIIAATNRNLQEEVRERRFRSDLYYRIGVFPIEIPPLRDRMQDLPLLTSYFVSQSSKRLGKQIEKISRATIDTLMAYDWPGNIRELQNVVERAIILSPGREFELRESLGKSGQPPTSAAAGSLSQDLRAIERKRILQALDSSGWKIKGEGNAASRLGLKPSSLRTRMKCLGIERTV